MSISLDRPVPRHSITMPPFVFFPTVRAHGFWRYLWPFSSMRQFIFTLAVSVVVIVVCAALARHIASLAPLKIALPAGLVLGVISVFPYQQLPGKLIISATRGPSCQLIPILERIILGLGYIEGSLSANSNPIHFRPKSAVLPSWFYSPEQDVELYIAYENIIEVRGPKGILNLMEMDLRWKLEE